MENLFPQLQFLVITSSDRTEFILIDSGGTEKKISLRLVNTENREISQNVKILIEHTNASVKRGEGVKLQGDATPDTTLTLTTKNKLGKILRYQYNYYWFRW